MKDSLLVRSLKAAVIGHLFALLLLILFSFLAVKSEDPTAAILPLVFVSQGAGAVVCGMCIRKNKTGISDVLVGGALFAIVPLSLSFFGSGEFFTWGVRLLVILAMLVLVGAIAMLFPKKKHKKRRKTGYSRKKR